MKCIPTKNRRPENVAGPFFVDDTCISCAACWKAAPDIFFSHAKETYAYVGKQPESLIETELAVFAQKLCPVGAIRQNTESVFPSVDPGLPKEGHNSKSDDGETQAPTGRG